VGESFPTVKVPRQCLLFLPVKIRCRQGKASGTEEGNALEENLSRTFAPLVRDFDVPVGRTT
jgi:hypothetical protein